MQRPAPIYGLTPGRMDLFWCATDGASLMHTWFDESRWQTEVVTEGNHPFAPAAASYVNQPGRMDVGWVERPGRLRYVQFDGGQWSDPSDLDPSGMMAVTGSRPSNFHPRSRLAACPGAQDRRSQNTEFLATDTAGHVWDLSFDGSTWTVADGHVTGAAHPPVQLRAQIYTPSAVPNLFWCDKTGAMSVSYAGPGPGSVNTTPLDGIQTDMEPAVMGGLDPGQVNIFWSSAGSSTTGRILRNTVWNGSAWATEDIAQHFSSYAAVESVHGLSPGRVDLFWRSEEGELRDTWFDGTAWRTDTIASELPFAALPAAIYDAAQGRIYVFWTDHDGCLLSASSDGTAWTRPSLISLGLLLDVDGNPLSILPDGTVWHAVPPGSYGPLWPAPVTHYGPAAAPYLPPRSDVFWTGADGTLKQAAWNGSTWEYAVLLPSPVGSLTRSHGAQLLVLFRTEDPGVVGWAAYNGIGWVGGPPFGDGVLSPLASCEFLADEFIYWIDRHYQLCEARLYTNQPKTTVIDYNYDPYRLPGSGDPPTRFPNVKFSARFAPTVLDGPGPDPHMYGLELFLCDHALNLWSVVYNVGEGPTYGARKLALGPTAWAPAAMTVPPANHDGGGDFIFWCAREDLSLRQSGRDRRDGTWHTTRIDPGPMASAPALLLLPSGELHVFWGDQQGRLKHNWASGNAMGNEGRPNGWQTEVVDAGPMGSEPAALYDEEAQRMSVFWLDRDGRLNQTALDAQGGAPRWHTVNIAPATGSEMERRDL